MKQIDRSNCWLLLAAFMRLNGLDVRSIAKAIGCPEACLVRILARASAPSDELLRQLGVLFEVGFECYSNLSSGQKQALSETLGAIGGGVLGFACISAAISGLGTVAGLSAAGVTSGLGALGALVGGGMVAGVSVVALAPIVAGVAGFGLVKGINDLLGRWRLDAAGLDAEWELVRSTQLVSSR